MKLSFEGRKKSIRKTFRAAAFFGADALPDRDAGAARCLAVAPPPIQSAPKTNSKR
jgi:hypothetical protein